VSVAEAVAGECPDKGDGGRRLQHIRERFVTFLGINIENQTSGMMNLTADKGL